MKYRAEIDGLRAVAVIPVILFHIGIKPFSGGFVGVDIFFVISGYLITTILIEDIENNRFSLTNFYERRARRILPALFFVMLCCIPFAWMWMLPIQVKDFSESLIAVSLFVSNIFFWKESGYFENSAEEKPLLHTWSLAVEEQYYILFPIFLIIAWRFGKNRVFWMIVIFACISLVLSEWGWRNNARANFYLIPTRAWELFAGSIAAFIIQKHGLITSNRLSLTGFIAVIISIFYYDSSTPFPSIYTLLPVFGVFLIILSADKTTFVAKFLSNRIFVAVGLMSYSLYLWHQPMIAFAKIYTFRSLDVNIKIVLLSILVLISYISWKYIEKPFRHKGQFDQKKIFSFSAVFLSAFIALGTLGYISNGDLWRKQSVEELKLQQAIDDWEYPDLLQESDIEGLYTVFKDKPIDMLFFGDSHAEQYSPIIRELGHSKNVNFGFLTGGGCPPIPNLFATKHPKCFDLFERLTIVLKQNPKISNIIIGGCFNCYFIEQTKSNINNPDYSYYFLKGNNKLYFRKGQGINEAWIEFIQFVNNLSLNYKVTILLDNPLADELDPKILLLKLKFQNNEFFTKKYPNILFDKFEISNEVNELNEFLLKKLAPYKQINVIRVMDIVCPNRICVPLINGNPIYKDKDHMRGFFVKDKFLNIFSNFTK